MKVLVETSAHHIHVSDEALEALFGKGATLTNNVNFRPYKKGHTG